MKVRGHQFFSALIKITIQLMLHTVLLVSQLPICIESYFCLFFNNWLKIKNSKPQYMIIINEFPNGKSYLARHEKTVNWGVNKNVNDHTWKRRNVVPYESLCNISLLQVRILRKIPGRGKRICGSMFVMFTWSVRFSLCAKLHSFSLISS